MVEAKDMHKYLRSGSEEYYTQEIAEKLLRSSMSLSDREFRLLRDDLDDALFLCKGGSSERIQRQLLACSVECSAKSYGKRRSGILI